MDLGLKNKVAMVSGASKGLGFAVAQALAREGAYVSIGSSDEGRAIDAAKRIEIETSVAAAGFFADVRLQDAIAGWHAATVRRFGGVDLLFTNSAGPPLGQTLGFEDSDWQAAFDLLVMSVVRLVRLVVPSMELRGGGAILTSTSSSVREPIPELVLSNALRLSVAGLAKTLAVELGPRGIRVNNILPGRIATERLRDFTRFNAERAGMAASETEARITATIPLGRFGTPDEFGCVAAFLLSDAASYITGVSVQVDGGLIRAVL